MEVACALYCLPGDAAVFLVAKGQHLKLNIPSAEQGGKFPCQQAGVGTADKDLALLGKILRVRINESLPLGYLLHLIDKDLDAPLWVQLSPILLVECFQVFSMPNT